MFKIFLVSLALLFSSCVKQSDTEAVGGYTPPGAIMAFGHANGAGAGGCPTGWIPANGVAQATATYKALDAAFATTWGARSGGNFQIPNLNGESRYLRGGTPGTLQAQATKLNGITAALTSNAVTASVTNGATGGQSATHNHLASQGSFAETSGGAVINGGGATYGGITSAHGATANASNDHTHSLTNTAVTGTVPSGVSFSNDGAETRPITAVVMYCIKY